MKPELLALKAPTDEMAMPSVPTAEMVPVLVRSLGPGPPLKPEPLAPFASILPELVT